MTAVAVARRGRLALVLCVLVVSVSVLSLAFVIEVGTHKCGSGQCNICVKLNETLDTLKQTGTGLVVSAPAPASAAFVCVVPVAAESGFLGHTPVSLKVKLNS